jgi:hypothetical protein
MTTALEPGALYLGSQYLLKTIDGGLHWKEISPDLTGAATTLGGIAEGDVTNDNARERGYGVIYSIALSPLDAKTIWVGTDTGLIQVTRDGGANWSNVTPPELTAWSKVTHIEASHFAPGEAWAAVDRHRVEDYRPYLYRTRDFGKTWTLVNRGLREPAFVNAVREDPARRGLLYAGTELGVAVSFDDGDQWQPLALNLPATSVRDLVIHGDDLIAATHGRGFWILDDTTPLRQIGADTDTARVHLFRPGTAIRTTPPDFSGTPFPLEEPKAKNPPNGAILDYYLPEPVSGEVKLEILDERQQTVRVFSTEDRAAPTHRQMPIADAWITPPALLTKNRGMNRFVWDLRYGDASGPKAVPGSYEVRLEVGGETYRQPLEVKLDPRSTATAEELARQLELGLQITRAMAQAKASGDGARQVLDELRVALAVTVSADREPPASAYALYEQAERELKQR